MYEKSALVEVIYYFRILKAFIILFLFFKKQYPNRNQNGKVLEETLASSNSDAVKTTLRGQRYLKMTLPLL